MSSKEFECGQCDLFIHRDVNGARSILLRAIDKIQQVPVCAYIVAIVIVIVSAGVTAIYLTASATRIHRFRYPCKDYIQHFGKIRQPHFF